MKLDLDAIEAREKAATPGPWVSCSDSHAPGNGKRQSWVEVAADSAENVSDVPNGPRSWSDAVFIAHAREDVPALVARVRELEEALEEALRPDPVWEQLDALAHKMLDLDKELEAKAAPAPPATKGDE